MFFLEESEVKKFDFQIIRKVENRLLLNQKVENSKSRLFVSRRFSVVYLHCTNFDMNDNMLVFPLINIKYFTAVMTYVR